MHHCVLHRVRDTEADLANFRLTTLSVALDVKFLYEPCGNTGRNFKSATLDWLLRHAPRKIRRTCGLSMRVSAGPAIANLPPSKM